MGNVCKHQYVWNCKFITTVMLSLLLKNKKHRFIFSIDLFHHLLLEKCHSWTTETYLTVLSSSINESLLHYHMNEVPK